MKRKPKSTLTATTTVRAFQLVVDDGQADKHFNRAIGRLEELLGRPALVKDLDGKVLTMFYHWLRDSTRFTAATRSTLEGAVLRLSRAAADLGLIDRPLIPSSHRSVRYKPVSSRNIGLLTYFEEHYLPERQRRDKPLSDQSVKTYRDAIRAYERFAPTSAIIRKITRKSLHRFRVWLLERDFNRKKAGNHAFAVAAIVKHARPDRFISVAGDGLKCRDPDRALEHVFCTMYLPAKPQITSKRTEHLYLMTFASYGRFLGRVPTLDDLSDEQLGAYMRKLKSEGRAADTVNGYRSKLRALWEWSARKKLVDEFPTIGEIPVPVQLPSAWTQEQLVALFEACGRMPGTVAGIPSPDWWRAIHLISWDTGERSGALFQLRWDWLDMKTRKLIVPAEFRKGGIKPMPYTLKRDTMLQLKRNRPLCGELILPFDRSIAMFYVRYKKLLKLAGLPYVRWKSSMQKMRRSFASHLEAAGGNATLALAHTSRLLTERSYLDPVLLDTTPPNELLFPLEMATAGN